LVYAGCGPLPLSETDRQVLGRPDEWVLVDKFVRDPAIRNWDAQTLAEFPDTGIAVLYSSHMLEHISHRQVPEVLAAWREKLASGGVVWLCVPDLLWMAEEIVRIANGSKPDGGHYSDIDGPYGMVLALYGSQHHDGEYHKSGFTKQSLEKLFKDAGYSRVEVKRDFDSAHDCGALFVQAIK
jgi:predicted SAM-dependent methyltransferase